MKRNKISDVVITGGSGYIGSSLARFFSERGIRVRTLDLRPQPHYLKAMNIPHSICDLTNFDDLKTNLARARLVIHTAIVQIPLINRDRKLGYEANIIGTQNVCKAVELSNAKGMILTSSWHVFGESGLNGIVSEGFGYRPDKVEDRARLYALCKNGQEVIVRLFNEFSSKVFGIIRMGTVLGEGMPERTAANIFINQALEGKELTPFRQSLYRPMIYVSIRDVQEGLFRFAKRILRGVWTGSTENSLESIINLFYPKAVTILELAETVRDLTMKITRGERSPEIRIIDRGLPSIFEEGESDNIRFDITRAKEVLGMNELISPRDELERIIKKRVRR